MDDKKLKRRKRHRRVRAKIKGTNRIPRLCIFRSNKHIYAQLIDDEKGHTLVSASDLDIGKSKVKSPKLKVKKELTGKAAVAYRVGQILAKKAMDLLAGKAGKKFEKIVFDRGGYKYHGRVKALADGAREGGLKF